MSKINYITIAILTATAASILFCFLSLNQVMALPITPPVTNPVTPPLIPTSTPKPTITPTVRPTTTPTVKPTITPTPTVSNQKPVIMTKSLPYATVLRTYAAKVEGYDFNLGDNLSMTFSGLPVGIRKSACTVYLLSGKKYISCVLSGRPITPGQYLITIKLSDYHSTTGLKLTLKVTR